MPIQEIIALVLSELRSAWRFRWYGAGAAWLVCLVGWTVIAFQPNVYEATARVYVDTSSVLRPLLQNRIVPPDMGTVLSYVRQSLLGRDHLEKIARENGLDLEVETPTQMERVLADLRDSIRVSSPDVTNAVYNISYRDEQRERAVGVVSTLLNTMEERTYGANQLSTDTAEQFLEERIREYEVRLEQAESALADFKKQNAGRLPGTQGGYYERMQSEREALATVQRELRLAQSKVDQLKAQLTQESGADLPATSLDARIAELQTELDRHLLQYTEKHPDVIAVREALGRLQEQRANQLREIGQAAAVVSPSLIANPIYQAVRIQLTEAEVDVAALRADEEARMQRLREFQALIDELPQVEAELARLNRDYDVIYDQYQSLVQSRETQALSRKAFDTDKVEFRVIDPPTAKPTPVAPKRMMLISLVFLGGIGLGGGLCWLLAQLRPVFANSRAVTEAIELPVLGVIIEATTQEQRLRKRLMTAVFFATMVVLAMLFAGAVLTDIAGSGFYVPRMGVV